MPNHSSENDRDRRDLPADLRALHDALLADGAVPRAPLQGEDRMMRFAVRLREEGQDSSPSSSPRHRLWPMTAALTLAVVIVALSGAFYLHHKPQSVIKPTVRYILALSSNNQVNPELTQLTAFNAGTGQVIWQDQPAIGEIEQFSTADGVVFVIAVTVRSPGNDQRTLTALDVATGKTLWQSPTQQNVFPPVTVVNSLAYYGISTGTGTSALAGVRIRDGARMWQSSDVSRRVTYIDSTGNGVIYASTYNPATCTYCPFGSPQTIPDGLTAFDLHSGKILWEADITGNGVARHTDNRQ